MKIDDQAKRNIQQLHCDSEDAGRFSTPMKQRKRRNFNRSLRTIWTIVEQRPFYQGGGGAPPEKANVKS
jgi:hypothetical protein